MVGEKTKERNSKKWWVLKVLTLENIFSKKKVMYPIII